jgi:hypothetical protein
MTKKWYTPDPTPDCYGETGYTTVTYRKLRTPEEIKERRKNAAKREADIDFIMSHPVSRYRYERENHINSTVKRLEKNIPTMLNKYVLDFRSPKRKSYDPNYSRTTEALYHYVRNYIGNEGEPTVLLAIKTADELRKEEADKALHKKRGTRRERILEQNAEDGVFVAPKEFTEDFISKIVKTRNLRNLSQKDLAMLVNRPERDIRDLEAGNMPFDGGLKSLLIWKLGLQQQ